MKRIRNIYRWSTIVTIIGAIAGIVAYIGHSLPLMITAMVILVVALWLHLQV